MSAWTLTFICQCFHIWLNGYNFLKLSEYLHNYFRISFLKEFLKKIKFFSKNLLTKRFFHCIIQSLQNKKPIAKAIQGKTNLFRDLMQKSDLSKTRAVLATKEKIRESDSVLCISWLGRWTSETIRIIRRVIAPEKNGRRECWFWVAEKWRESFSELEWIIEAENWFWEIWH